MKQVVWVFCSVMMLIVACTSLPLESQKIGFRPTHHTDTGFKNLYIDAPQKSFFTFLWTRTFGDDQWADHQAQADDIVTQQVDVAVLKSPEDQPQLTWLGHSTFLLQYRGINLLTDPIFSDRASPVSYAGPKRYIEHVIDYQQLPPIDYVVISHNHYDHLDETAIQQLGNKTHYFVPLGLKAFLIDQGVESFRVTELDWWQYRRYQDIAFTALPVQHWSARGLFDRYETLWAGWRIEMGDFSVFFAGDTGYNEQLFSEVGEASGGFDLGLIPIGAYEPRWFMQAFHVNPEEALKIHQHLSIKQSIGMHWGTFPLTAEPPAAPPEALRVARQQEPFKGVDFSTMDVGETRVINF